MHEGALNPETHTHTHTDFGVVCFGLSLRNIDIDSAASWQSL